jgi:hypothetical protein
LTTLEGDVETGEEIAAVTVGKDSRACFLRDRPEVAWKMESFIILIGFVRRKILNPVFERQAGVSLAEGLIYNWNFLVGNVV